jgi:type II secretory pathway pseudopilin PulG
MIIIGILAAIAIPVFLSQRAKARDTATKSDVSRLGKEVAAYYVDGTGSLTVSQSSGTVTLTSGATPVSTITVTPGSTLQGTPFSATSGSETTTWCVGMTNPSGAQKTYTFSASRGLATGACP